MGLNGRSYAGRAVFALPLGAYEVYVAASARTWVYPAHAGAVIGIGRQGSAVVPSFAGIDCDEDVRAGIRVTGPRVYGAVSYLTRGGNMEPHERGVGCGVEKLADVDQPFSLYGKRLRRVVSRAALHDRRDASPVRFGRLQPSRPVPGPWRPLLTSGRRFAPLGC